MKDLEHQILRYAQNDIPCHHRRSRCVVILNAAVGGVKDLEYHTVFLHQILRFAQNDNAEKCSETTV